MAAVPTRKSENRETGGEPDWNPHKFLGIGIIFGRYPSSFIGAVASESSGCCAFDTVPSRYLKVESASELKLLSSCALSIVTLLLKMSWKPGTDSRSPHCNAI